MKCAFPTGGRISGAHHLSDLSFCSASAHGCGVVAAGRVPAGVSERSEAFVMEGLVIDTPAAGVGVAN